MSNFWKYFLIVFKLSKYKLLYSLLPIIYGIYRLFIGITLLLDNVFFHKFKKQQISNPVFLLGHPRSGTTFVHRYILNLCNEFSGNTLWDMIFPSIIARKILKPLLPIVSNRFNKKNVYKQHIHKASLIEAETDDAAIFLRYFSGLLPWLYLKAWFCEDDKLIDDLKNNILNKTYNKFLKSIYQKNVLLTQKRLFSKSFTSILQIETILNNYPDAKIIILLRNPIECVPSSMSLLKNMLVELVDYDAIPQDIKLDYYQKIFSVSKYYHIEIKNVIEKYKDNNHVIFIKYHTLIQDFENQMNKILSFINVDITESIKSEISQKAEQQKSFKGKHIYSLEEFGFDKTVFDDELFSV